MSAVNYSMMKIPQLKLELKKYGLQISGNKAVLVSRLTEFLNPPKFHRDESKSNSKGNRGQSQKQIINIYTDGSKVDSSVSDGAKNIYIGRPSVPFLPSGNNPSAISTVSRFPTVMPVKPVFFKPSEEKKQEIITGIPSSSSSSSSSSGMIGEEEEEEEKVSERPAPKKLVMSTAFTNKLNKALAGNLPTTSQTLSSSIPLPQNVVLPTPSLNIPPPPPLEKKKLQILNKNQERVYKYIMKNIVKPPNLTPEELKTIINETLIQLDVPNTWSKNDSKLALKSMQKTFKKYD